MSGKKEIQTERIEIAKNADNEEKKVEVIPVVVTPVEKTPEVPVEVVSPEEAPELEKWVPKTSLGKEVMEKKITSMDEILDSGRKIVEPQIVDKLLPGLKNELILIGGRTGKGGGIERIPVRITAKMHQSGRRFRTSSAQT